MWRPRRGRRKRRRKNKWMRRIGRKRRKWKRTRMSSWSGAAQAAVPYSHRCRCGVLSPLPPLPRRHHQSTCLFLCCPALPGLPAPPALPVPRAPPAPPVPLASHPAPPAPPAPIAPPAQPPAIAPGVWPLLSPQRRSGVVPEGSPTVHCRWRIKCSPTDRSHI